jgi:hypothetical protein
MAGESIRDNGSWVDLATSGGSITSGSFVEATASGFSLATNGGSRPHLEFEIEFTFGTGPTVGGLALHHAAQDLFGGTSDGLTPSSTNLVGLLAAIPIATSTTSTQRLRFDVMFAPTDSKYWIQNDGTSQTVSSGWKLRARAWSLKAA